MDEEEELLLWLAEFDRWEAMSDKERDLEIRNAIRRAS